MQHDQIPYDPFSLPDTVPEGAVAGKRRPRILTTKLHSLTWSGNIANSAEHGSVTLGKREVNGVLVSSGEHGKVKKQEQEMNGVASSQQTEDNVITRVGEVGIFGEPLFVDDRIRYIVSFMLRHVTSPSVEVEAKLGLVISKDTNRRAAETFPGLCEAPLRQEIERSYRFESSVSMGMFQYLNKALNRRVTETSKLRGGRVMYLRARQCDVSYPGKIRQTYDMVGNESTGQTDYIFRSVQTKRRQGNINMVCPLYPVDVRFSASSEISCEVPQNVDALMKREKDRISYKYKCLSVDITTVHVFEPASEQPEVVHEVEVEVDSEAHLYEEIEKYNRGQLDSKLFDIAATLVHTTRFLSEEVKKYTDLGQQAS